ncbi:MAG: trimeric intracellular cation channel family protein, partial [Acidimicrobiia bacterium]
MGADSRAPWVFGPNLTAVFAVELPDLATSSPLWLALLTVGVNAIVGALRGYTDTTRHWDIVGVTSFALLMGLGGGFIRDALIGNVPAESLRRPWYLVTVLAAVVIVLLIGRWISHVQPLIDFLNALALGLFAITGVARALDVGLPTVSAVLIGTLTAVGGGVLVSILQGQIPEILLAGAPNALLAVWGSITYAAVEPSSTVAASFAGIASGIVAQYLAKHLGVTT